MVTKYPIRRHEWQLATEHKLLFDFEKIRRRKFSRPKKDFEIFLKKSRLATKFLSQFRRQLPLIEPEFFWFIVAAIRRERKKSGNWRTLLLV